MEQAVDLEALTSQRGVYTDWLARWYGVTAAARALDDVRLPGLEPAAVRREARLAADLRGLGCDPRSLPICDGLPPLDDVAAALGCAYVLEGAALGGGLVAAALASNPVGQNWPRAFVTGDGGGRGRRWRAFRRTAEAWADTPARQDEVVTAAVRTFDACERWFAHDRMAA